MRSNGFTYLQYSEKDHSLFIGNQESGRYVSKIKMNLYRDTLSLDVYKKLIFPKATGIMNSASTDWKVKLRPEVRFVKLGDVVTPLSEIRKYNRKSFLQSYYATVEIFPQKFPYVAK
jgi:hypothetical protein